jgi:uncharacterized membrane protein YtjA (UPF0391 family)
MRLAHYLLPAVLPQPACRNERHNPLNVVYLKGVEMLHYAAVFLVIALIAALFGFGGIAVGAVEIAKVLFFIFIVLFLVSLIGGLVRRPRV